MMRSIYIDATHFNRSSPTGVELYTQSLLIPLSIQLQKQRMEVFWIGHSAAGPDEMPPGVNWLSSPHVRLWSQTALPRLLSTYKPDLYFSPSGMGPLRYEGAVAFTVHDMASYAQPEAYSLGNRLRLQWIGKRAATQAKRIIVPSHYVAREIREIWGIAPEAISVVPHGFSAFKGEVEEPHLKSKDPVLLFMSRLERKKNLLPMLEGFHKLALERPVQLILAGAPGFGYSEIEHCIKSLPSVVQSRIIQPGYVSEPQKNGLYDVASVVAVPCPVEGFGLPVLEAFAHCVPVVCAQGGALPEIAQTAALYAQPDIGTDWYLQFKTLLDDKEVYAKCQAEGALQVKKYTWEKSAKATAEALISTLEAVPAMADHPQD